MNSNVIFQVGVLIILLIVVLTLAFYLLYPLIVDINSRRRVEVQKSPLQDNEPNAGEETPSSMQDSTCGDSEGKGMTQEVKSESFSINTPIVDYASKANAILNENKRIETIVEKENMAMMGRHPLPDYSDDPSSIDLADLAALRRDVRRMSRELSLVKRTNIDLQNMIATLHKDHADALSRVANTDLWSAEKQRWASDFEKAYRSYEEQKAKLPPSEKKGGEVPTSNNN